MQPHRRVCGTATGAAADGGSVAAEGGSAEAADGGGSGTGQQPPFCIQTLFKGLCLNRA